MLYQINKSSPRCIGTLPSTAPKGALRWPWPRKGKTLRDRNRGATKQREDNRASRQAWYNTNGASNDSFPLNAAGGKGNSSKARKH